MALSSPVAFSVTCEVTLTGPPWSTLELGTAIAGAPATPIARGIFGRARCMGGRLLLSSSELRIRLLHGLHYIGCALMTLPGRFLTLGDGRIPIEGFQFF